MIAVNAEVKEEFPSSDKAKMTTLEVNGTKQLKNEAMISGKSIPEIEPKLESKVETTDINANTKDLKIEIVEDLAEDEENNEETDGFDLSAAPTTHKKEHATQNTLEFVYHHSSSTSPSHNSGNFPVSPTGTVPSGIRPLATHRRPSGVPPPARELKPGDYLYQRNLNNKFELSEDLEEEEEKS